MKSLISVICLLFLVGCTTPPDERTAFTATRNDASYQIIEEDPVDIDQATSVLEGSYRCWQFNVDGYGGSCRTLSPIVLAGDGTYTISSTAGTYTISADTITLSASDYWGPGTIQEDGLQIYFNYTYNGKQYEVTYLKE